MAAFLADPGAVSELKGEKGDKGRDAPTAQELKAAFLADSDAVAKLKGADASIPSGTVAAFDLLDRCPVGWSPFAPGQDRVIVGAGGRYRGPIAHEPRHKTGGEHAVALTIEQMPIHTHETAQGIDWGPVTPGPKENPNALHFETKWESFPDAIVAAEGGGQTHENMPPYIALYFCRKD